MSLLIRALKQAERDHLASIAAPTAPRADAGAEAPAPHAPLQLEPVEAHRAVGEAREYLPPREERAQGEAASQGGAGPASPGPPQPQSRATAQPSVAPAHPSQETDPERDARSAAQSEVGSVLASMMAASTAASSSAQPAVPQRVAGQHVVAAGLATAARAAVSEPLPAASDSSEADARAAARQLVAPAPDRRLARRVVLLSGAIAGVVLATIAAMYWQAASPDFSGRPRTRATTANVASTAANSAPSAPVAVAGPAAAKANSTIEAPSPVRHAAHAVPGTAIASAAASPPASTASEASSGAGTPKVAAASVEARAASVIHLRAPELSAEKIHALLQDAYSAAARGQSVVARAAYERVIDIDNNNSDAWIGLASLAVNSGDLAGANGYYRHALEIDPGDSVALGGLLGLQSGVEPQEYEARLRQLIARDGAQPSLLAALGKLLARQGRWLEAQDAFFQAWTADPNQADVAFNLAVSLERIRQPDAAVSYYRRALQLAQDHSARFDQAVARDRVAALLAAAAAGLPGDAEAEGRGSAPSAAAKN